MQNIPKPGELYWDMVKGNEPAHQFLCAWHQYCHDIDDLVDNPHDPEKFSEQLCGLLIRSAALYSLPFYREHAHELFLIVAASANAWADSVKWEKADQELWKRQAADILRHAGIEMIFAVSTIVSGYAHMRQYSAALRTGCHATHHDQNGDPK